MRPSFQPLRISIGLVWICVLTQCAPKVQDGRGWVAEKSCERISLPPGELFVSDKLPPLVRRNYASFLEMLVTVFKDGHLYNQNAVPFVVYLMSDAAEMRAFCSAASTQSSESRTVFVPAERSVYAHAGGQPLIDGGVSRGLMRDMSRTVLHDMFAGDCPPWLAHGLSRMFADGELGAKQGDLKPRESRFDWFVGLPDSELWQRALGDRSTLPTFEAVRSADSAGFAALGREGELVATAAVYLLKQLRQLRDLVWKMRPAMMPRHDAPAVLAAMRECVPRYDAYFADPLGALFQQRPDYLAYLQCAAEADSAKALALAKKNAAANPTVGGYWWQYGRLLLAQSAQQPQSKAAAVEALEKCRGCLAHRERPAALRALAGLHNAAERWKQLESVVAQQHRESLLPTPRMYLMLARCQSERGAEETGQTIRLGLELPPAGFEADVQALRELGAALKEKKK